MKDRSRWYAFVERIASTPALDAAAFRALAAEIRAEPDPSVRRAYVIHLARLEREVASDEQLRELATLFAGGRDHKVPRYIEAALLVRRVRRGEPGAREEALRSRLAFVRASVPRPAGSGRT